MSLSDEQVFENEVRRVAQALWPGRHTSGAVILAGDECDGFFETEECIHLLECTVSRGQGKARDDIRKLDKNVEIVRKKHSDKGIKTWFITRHDPTADQMKEVRQSSSGVTGISFSTFQSKLVDVPTYLECRCNHRFGSVEHPLGQNANEIKYIEIPILSPDTQNEWTVPRIANELVAGSRITMVGDYGIGKSMTLREVFRYLRSRYLQHHLSVFPIHINLREHHGQNEPAEIIERHARVVERTSEASGAWSRTNIP